MSDARTVIAKALREHTRVQASLHCSELILAALAEAGLVIVPRAPTEKMVDAGLRASEAQSVRRIYFEMVRAANEQ